MPLDSQTEESLSWNWGNLTRALRLHSSESLLCVYFIGWKGKSYFDSTFSVQQRASEGFKHFKLVSKGLNPKSVRLLNSFAIWTEIIPDNQTTTTTRLLLAELCTHHDFVRPLLVCACDNVHPSSSSLPGSQNHGEGRFCSRKGTWFLKWKS